MGGKGGVGKTTCAAMRALRLASPARGRRARRTLLVTTDPASSLSAILQTDIGSEPRAIPGAEGLFAASVDASRAFERWLAPRRALVSTIAVRGSYLDDEDVARLLGLSLPGVDEVIGLVEVQRLAEGFDAVVVDTAPTGHTLRLFAAPALLDRAAVLLDALQSHHRAVVSALRGSYRADAADALIADLKDEGASLAARLRDESTDISWVTLPEPMALEETADALAELDSHGIAVRRLIVNRVTPPARNSRSEGGLAARKPQSGEGECEWCDARRRFESRALAPVLRRFGEREIVMYPEVEREPRGIDALRALQKRRTTFTVPRAAPPIGRRVRARVALPKTAPDTAVPLFSGRWLLVAGKGGVGKSTCAAAAALRLAVTRRVLLLSADPAHSLGDVFGERFDNTPRAVTGVPNLYVREIDAAAEMDRLRQQYMDAVDEAFGRVARVGAGDRAAFRELIDLAPPGIDEVIAMADVADALTDGRGQYDTIVTDTAPTGHALRLLETPDVLRAWAQALMTILLKYREVVGAGALAELLVALSKRMRGLRQTLADPAKTQVLVVTRAAALPSDETRHLIDDLDRLGIAVRAVIVNAAGRGTCGRCRTIARAQADEVSRLPYTRIVAPAEVPPPHGVAALRAWIDTWRPAIS